MTIIPIIKKLSILRVVFPSLISVLYSLPAISLDYQLKTADSKSLLRSILEWENTIDDNAHICAYRIESGQVVIRYYVDRESLVSKCIRENLEKEGFVVFSNSASRMAVISMQEKATDKNTGEGSVRLGRIDFNLGEPDKFSLIFLRPAGYPTALDLEYIKDGLFIVRRVGQSDHSRQVYQWQDLSNEKSYVCSNRIIYRLLRVATPMYAEQDSPSLKITSVQTPIIFVVGFKYWDKNRLKNMSIRPRAFYASAYFTHVDQGDFESCKL